MPKNDLFTTTHIIIQEVKGVTREAVQILCIALGKVYLCVREEADVEVPNPHYHLLVKFDPPASRESLGTKISKLFSQQTMGKNDKHILKWNTIDAQYFSVDDKQSRYCCKGPDNEKPIYPDVIYKTISDDLVKDAHETYWNIWETVYKPIRDKNTKKEIKRDEKIIKIFLSEGISPSFEQICSEVLKDYRGKVNDHVAWPVIQAVMYHFYPNRVRNDFMNRMRNKWNPTPEALEDYESNKYRLISEPSAPRRSTEPEEIIHL